MSQTVLLTGISGFIARHVALALLREGFEVRGTVRRLDRGDEVRAALAPHLGGAALSRLTFVEADLGGDAGWAEAMAGVDTLVHTASPFSLVSPKDEADLIRPAVEGTLRVLGAAQAAGIRRVVLTSSTVAIVPPDRPGTFDESSWVDATSPIASTYARSKILAERAAWDFAARTGMVLTTINPGLVFGAPLGEAYGSSVALVLRLLRGRDPMLPRIEYPVVDVTDIAQMHLRAVQDAATGAKRYLGAPGTLSFIEMGRILKAAYPARRIATRAAPAILLRLMAVFDTSLRLVLPALDKKIVISNARAVSELGMRFTPPDQALRNTAKWLIQSGKA